MKEAAGEANMTVITIVLIGVVAAVGAILIPRLMATTSLKSCCQEKGWTWSAGSCYQKCSLNSSGKISSCTSAVYSTSLNCSN